MVDLVRLKSMFCIPFWRPWEVTISLSFVLSREPLHSFGSGLLSSFKASKGRLSLGTSLVVQWLKICLPMQRTWAQSLVREDPTSHASAKPMHHNHGSLCA